MRIRTIALITLSIVLGIADLLFDRVYLAAEEPNASSSADMVIIDGVAVPDIGPIPAFVPMPMGNVNYLQKVDLGKQLYFDGRLSKNNAISCAFCHNPGTDFADARQFSIGAFGTAAPRP